MNSPHTRQPGDHGNQENGYTLIELLFAMQIVMLVITLVYTNVLFFQKYYAGVESRFNDRMKYRVLSHVMIKEISETREIVKAGPEELIIVVNANDTCCWNLTSGIVKNQRSNPPLSKNVPKGAFQYLIQISASQYWTAHPGTEEIRQITAVRLNLNDRKNEINHAGLVTIRLLKRKISLIS